MYTRSCIVCGNAFIAERPNTKLCSDACKNARIAAQHRDARQRERERRASSMRDCAYCGKSFAPNGNEIYCSDRCYDLSMAEEIRASLFGERGDPSLRPQLCSIEQMVAEGRKRHLSYGQLQAERYAKSVKV